MIIRPPQIAIKSIRQLFKGFQKAIRFIIRYLSYAKIAHPSNSFKSLSNSCNPSRSAFQKSLDSFLITVKVYLTTLEEYSNPPIENIEIPLDKNNKSNVH